MSNIEKIGIRIKEIKYPTTLSLIMSALCYYCLHKMDSEYSISIRLIILAACYISSIVIVEHFIELIQFLNTTSKKVVFICSWLYGAFAISGVSFIDSEDISIGDHLCSFLLNSIWILPVAGAAAFCVTLMIKKLSKNTPANESLFTLKEKGIIFSVIIVLGILFLIAFNPAITSPDSEECYGHAYNILIGKPINDSHPAFYKFLLSILMRINKSVSFIIICQMVLYSLGIIRSISLLNRNGISKKCCYFILIFFGLSYNTMIQIVTLWKDIPYTISLLWLSTLIGEYVIASEKVGRLWNVCLVTSCIMVSFVRHGGLLPVSVIILLLLLLCHNKKRIALCAAFFGLAFLLIKYPLFSAINVEKSQSSGLKYQGPVGDLQYVYHMGGELDSYSLRLVEMAELGLEDDYEPFYVSNAWWNLNEVPIKDFVGSYMRTLIKHPAAMTKSILIRSNYMWTIVKPARGVESCVSRLTESHRDEAQFEISFPKRKENVLTVVLSKIFKYIEDLPLVHMLYWRVGIYVMILLSLFLMIIGNFSKKSLVLSIPFIPILMNDAVLAISTGSPSYRYYWPNMVLSSFLIAYGIIALRVINDDKE